MHHDIQLYLCAIISQHLTRRISAVDDSHSKLGPSVALPLLEAGESQEDVEAVQGLCLGIGRSSD